MKLLRWYYLATPLFFLADLLWGWNVRVAFLDAFPAGRWAYYGLCSAIGIAVHRRPALAPRLGLLESSANLGLLVASVFLWYARMLEWAGSESATVAAVEPRALVNFVLAAGAGAASYYVRRASVISSPPGSPASRSPSRSRPSSA